MKKLLNSSFLLAFLLLGCSRETTHDVLAQCINDSGATFYGAYWCPHCQDQKKAFGDSVDLLPYVECDVNGKNSQATLCKAENVTTYPTWKFSDGSTETGVLSLSRLSELTSCPLPGEESILMGTGE